MYLLSWFSILSDLVLSMYFNFQITLGRSLVNPHSEIKTMRDVETLIY